MTHTKCPKLISASVLSTLCLANAAHSSIVSISGNVTQIAAPLGPINPDSFALVMAWNERQNVTVSNLPSISNPYTLFGFNTITYSGTYSGACDSHLIYTSDFQLINTTITLSGPVIAIQSSFGGWDYVNSIAGPNPWDPIFAPNGLEESNIGVMDIETASGTISVNGNQVTITNMFGHPPGFDVAALRIITAVPTPAATWTIAGCACVVVSRRRRV